MIMSSTDMQNIEYDFNEAIRINVQMIDFRYIN